MQEPSPPWAAPSTMPSRSKWRIPRIAGLFLTIFGVVICSILLRIGFGGGPILGASLCKPSQSVNCDFVLASRWSRIGSLPVSALGLAYFAALAAWLGFVGLPNRAGRYWQFIPLGVAALGLCGSVYFVYVMAVHLPVWCPWCLAAHGVNAMLFISLLAGWPRAPSPEAPYPTIGRALGFVAGCGGFMILVIAIVFAVGAQMTAGKLQTEFLKIANNVDYVEWRWRQGERREIPIRADDLSTGPADAANTVVVFVDIQCASCAGFHRYTNQLLKRHPNVRIAFKNFPMSRACNAYVNEAFHYFSCEAAQAMVAAQIAGSVQQALDFQSRLFENAAWLDDRPYASLAKAVGIDPAKFSTVLAGPVPAARVADDIELAHRLGVEATPAVFLNGRKLWNWHLLNDEVRPKVDLSATEQLWDRLLK